MPRKRALVIHNPVSGQHRAESVRRRITSGAAAYGAELEIRETQGVGDALRWAEHAHEEGFDLILAVGGDGTVMEALSGQIKGGRRVPVAQLPTGTANLIARALGVPTGVRDALAVAFTGPVVTLDVGYLPQLDRHFALVAGAGFDARMIEDAPRGLKRLLGFPSYLLSGLKNLFNLRNTSLTVEVDGERHNWSAHTVLIVNIGAIERLRLALGPDIHPHDGVLNTLVISRTSSLGMLRLLLRLFFRRYRNGPDLHYLRGRAIRVQADPPLPVQIDGELSGVTPLHVEVVPEGTLIVVPEKYAAARPTALASSQSV